MRTQPLFSLLPIVHLPTTLRAIALVSMTLFGLCGCQASKEGVNTRDRLGPYSEAVIAGDFVFLSGQLGMDHESGQLADGLEGQARQALTNLSRVAEAAGVELADAVRCEVYLLDMRDYAAFNAIYAEYFPAPAPARTCVQVAALPRQGRVEVAATVLRR